MSSGIRELLRQHVLTLNEVEPGTFGKLFQCLRVEWWPLATHDSSLWLGATTHEIETERETLVCAACVCAVRTGVALSGDSSSCCQPTLMPGCNTLIAAFDL